MPVFCRIVKPFQDKNVSFVEILSRSEAGWIKLPVNCLSRLLPLPEYRHNGAHLFQ